MMTGEMLRRAGLVVDAHQAFLEQVVDYIPTNQSTIRRFQRHGDAERISDDSWFSYVEEAIRSIDDIDWRHENGKPAALTRHLNKVVSPRIRKRRIDANRSPTPEKGWTDEARKRVATILYTAAEGLRVLAVTLYPFMPRATTQLWHDLGAEVALGSIGNQNVTDAGRWGQLPVGATLTKGESLFPRLPDDLPT